MLRTPASVVQKPQKRRNITMAMISAFTTVDKMAHNSRKFAFTLSPANYGYWKTMIEPFIITNNLRVMWMFQLCPSKIFSLSMRATELLSHVQVGSPSMSEAHQVQLSELTAQLSALGFQVPSSPCLPISSPSSVSHLSPTSQTSLEYSNGQPSPVSTTLITTPPPPPPPITQLKWDKNGAITCYKARFVANRFQQQPGIKFFHETFSPIIKSKTIRAVLSLAVTNNWPLRQLDVHNAFLHRNLKEQASRAWFERLFEPLFDLGFKGSKTDPYLFNYSRGDTLLYILVYVDDIIVAEAKYKALADTVVEITWIQALLNELGIHSSSTPILWCDNLCATYSVHLQLICYGVIILVQHTC
ncbi:retrovirus-related pol polyprotein from transposon TNT 1-94 [Tanacetum coccineum]